MGTDTRQVVMLQTTDAEFRTWVAAMIDQLNDIGLTQTADTGQINTTTVLKPAGVSASQGYAIFRFNDALQATAPIYLKIEFGSGAGAATNPQIWTTWSSATDGAGTLGGISYRARTVQAFTTGNAGSYPWAACYNTDVGTFWAAWANSAGINVMSLAARTGDAVTGAPNELGVLTVATSGSWAARLHDIALSSAETGSNLAAAPYTLASAEPVFMHEGRIIAFAASSMLDTGYIVGFPGILGYAANQLPTFFPCYASPYGVEYTYLALGPFGGYNVLVNGGNNDRPLLIWE